MVLTVDFISTIVSILKFSRYWRSAEVSFFCRKGACNCTEVSIFYWTSYYYNDINFLLEQASN